MFQDGKEWGIIKKNKNSVCVCLILIKNEQWLLNPSWLMIGLSVQLSN